MFPFDIKNVAITAAIALAVGFSAGYVTKGKFVKADGFDAVTTAQHQTATGIEKSLVISSAVESQVTASTNQVATVRKAVAQRMQQQEQQKEKPNETGTQIICNWSLDVGTVRMLDGARTGADVDPASLGDAESKAPSDVSAADFVDNDLEIVGLYRELAERHDALVDYVDDLIQKQAK